MPMTFDRAAAIGVALAAGALLSACAESRIRLSNDYGEAVRQDAAAQVADPDARYAGTPAPGSSGHRVELAQRRYVTGKVLQPPPPGTTVQLNTTNNASNGGGGGGGGDEGASASTATGP